MVGNTAQTSLKDQFTLENDKCGIFELEVNSDACAAKLAAIFVYLKSSKV